MIEFNVNDTAVVTHTISSRKGVVYPGETVKVTSVFYGTEYTIVDIKPYSDKPRMVDVCCNEYGPLRKVLSK